MEWKEWMEGTGWMEGMDEGTEWNGTFERTPGWICDGLLCSRSPDELRLACQRCADQFANRAGCGLRAALSPRRKSLSV